MQCLACNKLGTLACGACQAPYCGQTCQIQDWPVHSSECNISGKFSEAEYKKAIVVSKHVRIIWDKSVGKNKKRRETNKEKKRIYLRLNPQSDAKYIINLLSKIEQQRHAQGDAFWSVQKRQKRDTSPARPIVPVSPAPPALAVVPQAATTQSVLAELQKAYKKSLKQPKPLYDAFNKVLQRHQTPMLAELLPLLETQIGQATYEKGVTMKESKEAKVLDRIREQLIFWVFDQVFQDISVTTNPIEPLVNLEKAKADSYNVAVVVLENFRSKKWNSTEWHLKGKIEQWSGFFLSRLRDDEDYIEKVYTWAKQRLAGTGKQEIGDIQDAVNEQLWTGPVPREFDVYYS
jgi:hypothetical protein